MNFINLDGVRINLDNVSTYYKCADPSDNKLHAKIDLTPYEVRIVYVGKKKSDKFTFSHVEERDKLLDQLDKSTGVSK